MKKFKITRQNYLRVILAAYVIIIATILGVKWTAFSAEQKRLQQQALLSGDASKSMDYKRMLSGLRSNVSKDGKEFLEVAKERFVGKNVARMSDLDEIVEGALTKYFG